MHSSIYITEEREVLNVKIVSWPSHLKDYLAVSVSVTESAAIIFFCHK